MNKWDIYRGDGASPRLLIVVNVPWFFVMHRLSLALMARSRGIDVHIACGEGEGREDIDAAGFPFHRLPLTRRHFAPLHDAITIAALIRLYSRLRPDVIHHITLKPIILGSIAARICRRSRVINSFAGLGHVFGDTSRFARIRRGAVQKMLASSMKSPKQLAVFENSDDRELLIEARSVSREQSLVISGVGVDIDEYAVTAEPPAPICVLMAGRMLREKGVVYFADVARRLKKRGVIARFLLAGVPDPVHPGSITEAQLKTWEKEGIVEWLGFRGDMPQLLRAAHVVCLPTYYREGVPRILMEGASSGRPLVATDMPGCRDVVRDGVNGFLVPPHDVTALEAALYILISDAALRAKFGAAGRRIAEDSFDLTQVLEKFWAVYLAAGLREPSP